MYPVLAKALPKSHRKVTVSPNVRIDSDTERIHASECEGVFYQCRRVCIKANETVLRDCTVVDFECDIAMRVLISKIELAELYSSLRRELGHQQRISIVIGIP